SVVACRPRCTQSACRHQTFFPAISHWGDSLKVHDAHRLLSLNCHRWVEGQSFFQCTWPQGTIMRVQSARVFLHRTIRKDTIMSLRSLLLGTAVGGVML